MTIITATTITLLLLCIAGIEATVAGAATGLAYAASDYLISFTPKKHPALMLIMKILALFVKILILIIAFATASSFGIISENCNGGLLFVTSMVVTGVAAYTLIFKMLSEKNEK